MQMGIVTTPFGRRPVKLSLVKGQLEAAGRSATARADKWKIFRDVCEAKDVLGLQDRSLAVLHALLSFYPEAELGGEGGLVVFPSNNQLALRAHGIAGTTLRRHLMALVEAGLIQRKDSPNGKRYAHRDRAGAIEDAFGFSLAPLVAREAELVLLAQRVVDERRMFKRAKEALTLCRRDVRKLISAAVEEGADGDWGMVEGIYVGLVARLPRSPSRETVDVVLEEMSLLRDEIINMLKLRPKAGKIDGNASHSERHIQNSNPESISELEPRSEKGEGAEPVKTEVPLKAFPLSVVLKACPDISEYGSAGTISNWRDLMAAAVVVRSMLGISSSAYEDACEVMGAENAAVAVACILERAGHINSPGGYLRDLTARTGRGEFSLGPALMALLRVNGRTLEKRA